MRNTPIAIVNRILDRYTRDSSRRSVARTIDKYIEAKELLVVKANKEENIEATYRLFFKEIITDLYEIDKSYQEVRKYINAQKDNYFTNLFKNYRKEKSEGKLELISLAYIWFANIEESKDFVKGINTEIFSEKNLHEIQKQGIPLTTKDAKEFDFSRIEESKKPEYTEDVAPIRSVLWFEYFFKSRLKFIRAVFYLFCAILILSTLIFYVPNSVGNKVSFFVAKNLLSGEIRQEFYPDIDHRSKEKFSTGTLFNEVGLQILRTLVDRKYLPAKKELGLRYLNGFYVEYDPELAFQIFKSAEETLDAFIHHHLGYQYHYGIGVKRSFKESVLHYNIAISQGNKSTNNNLGWLYYTALGRDYNPELAEQYFMIAASAGVVIALNNLGIMHENGHAHDSNIETARRYFQAAADVGNPHAKANLGDLYLRGLVEGKDASDAIELFRDAALKGATWAIVRLGRIKEQGLGLDGPNIQAAKADYEEAANLGNGRAMWHLGQLYESGKLGEDKSQEAFKWYKKIELSDDPVALTILGRHYMNSFIIPDRDEEAKKLFEKAKDRGSAWAASQLAWLYETGRLGQSERSKAVDEYRFASDRGHAWARYRLGRIYLNPKSNPHDSFYGGQLIESAARLHNVFVRRQIARMYRYGDLVELDRHRAYDIYRSTAALGDAKSYFHMAEMYGLGDRNGEPDANLALENFKNAVELAKFQKDLGFLHNLSAERILRPFFDEEIQHDLASVLREASELGSISAMAAIAALHFDFESASLEEEEAIKWLKLSADKDHTESLTMLIDIYYNKINSIDSEYLNLYINRVRQAAGLGIYSAIEHMKDIGDEALLTKTNEPEWLTAFIHRTESSNFTRDQLEISEIYRLGIGDVTKQPEKSIIWLERAMMGGNREARNRLAWQFASGIDGLLDIDRAIEILKISNPSEEYIFGSLGKIKDSILNTDRDYELKASALSKIEERMAAYKSQITEKEIVDRFKFFMKNTLVDD